MLFDSPTQEDLAKFFEATDARKGNRIWLHCAANLRVTAFLGLYRQLREGWPADRAFALMNDFWKPNAVWEEFIKAHPPRNAEAQRRVLDAISALSTITESRFTSEE